VCVVLCCVCCVVLCFVVLCCVVRCCVVSHAYIPLKWPWLERITNEIIFQQWHQCVVSRMVHGAVYPHRTAGTGGYGDKKSVPARPSTIEII